MTLRRAAVLLAVAAVFSGCASPVTSSGGIGDEKATSEVVTRGDIATFITFDVSVAENAEYVVRAPEAGPISLKVAAGATVSAGQVLAVIGGNPLKSPGAGSVVAVTHDRVAERNSGVITLRAAGMALVGTAPAATLLRLSQPSAGHAKAQISGGPGPFDCTLAGGPELREALVYQTCLPVAGLTFYPGLTGVMAVPSGTRTGVLTLPLAAVAGTTESGLVRRIGADAHEELVSVKLGISDGSRVEIVAGLNEGDRVAVPAPNLPGMS